LYVRDASEDKGDARLHTGKRVDVKTTSCPDGHLLAPRWKKPTVDYYALMISETPWFRFAGFMSATDLLRPERLRDLGWGKGYVASQGELSKGIPLIGGEHE